MASRFIIPLDDNQVEILHQSRNIDNDGFYNICKMYFIAKDLNVSKLINSIRCLIIECKLLNCRVIKEDKYYFEESHTEIDDIININIEPNLNFDQMFTALKDKWSVYEFDLDCGPLASFFLEKTLDNGYVFGICIHHIISDEESVRLLFSRISDYYNDRTSLEKLSFDCENNSIKDLNSWDSYLFDSDFSPVFKFKSKYDSLFVANSIKGEINTNIVNELNHFSSDSSASATIFPVLSFAFALATQSITNRNNFVFGVPFKKQSSFNEASLFNNSINLLPVNFNIDSSSNVCEEINNLSEKIFFCFENSDTPLPDLLQRYSEHREFAKSGSPFSLVINYIFEDTTSLSLKGIKATPLRFIGPHAKYPITLHLYHQRDNSIEYFIQYDINYLDDRTVKALSDLFMETLKKIPRERSIKSLSSCDKYWKNGNFLPWNKAQPSFSENWSSLGNRFSFIAREFRDKPAIYYDGNAYSFSWLDETSSKVACFFINSNFQKGTPVSLIMSRSIDLIVSVLACAKAGLPYVIVEEEKIFEFQDILNLHSIDIAVVSDPNLHISGMLNFLNIHDMYETKIDVSRLDARIASIEGHDSLYYCFTSGSTGVPKCASIPHRSIFGYIFNDEQYRFRQNDSFLQYSSLQWDAFTLELWTPLLIGASCTLSSSPYLTPLQIVEESTKYNISVLWITASVFNKVMELKERQALSVTTLLVGGERLSHQHVSRYAQVFPNAKLINGYGPCECTVFTTAYCFESPLEERSIPIGTPVGDRVVYILNNLGGLSTKGAVGELCIAGPAVGLGYLNNEDKSSSSFVENTVNKEHSSMMFKTGDLVQINADNQLDYVGRVDRQVKVRGKRVDLDGLELMINSFVEVEQCKLIVDKGYGSDQLVAYIKKRENSKFELQKFKSNLIRETGHYFIDFVQVIDNFNTNGNGKLDIRCLKNLLKSNLNLHMPSDIQEEIDEYTEKLCIIISRILNGSNFQINTNFFDLGITSLNFLEIIDKLNESFPGSSIEFVDFFQYTTIARLAEEIKRRLNI